VIKVGHDTLKILFIILLEVFTMFIKREGTAVPEWLVVLAVVVALVAPAAYALSQNVSGKAEEAGGSIDTIPANQNFN